MKWNSNLTKALPLAVTVMLLMAMLCRGVWAAQLAQHDSAPIVDLVVVAVDHGHYHAPPLDHLHDDLTGITDDDHPIVHSILSLDLQGMPPLVPLKNYSPNGSLVLLFEPEPLSPHKAGLFRPPRSSLLTV